MDGIRRRARCEKSVFELNNMDSKTTVAASRTMAARVATTIRGNFALAFRRGARRSPGPMLPQAFVWGIVAAAPDT